LTIDVGGKEKWQEKVEAINFYHLFFFSGLAGCKDAKSAEKALREIRDFIEKNKQFLFRFITILKLKSYLAVLDYHC